MVAGFPAGKADGHHLINRSNAPAVYLEIGSRIAEDGAVYSDVDMEARPLPEGAPRLRPQEWRALLRNADRTAVANSTCLP